MAVLGRTVLHIRNVAIAVSGQMESATGRWCSYAHPARRLEVLEVLSGDFGTVGLLVNSVVQVRHAHGQVVLRHRLNKVPNVGQMRRVRMVGTLMGPARRFVQVRNHRALVMLGDGSATSELCLRHLFGEARRRTDNFSSNDAALVSMRTITVLGLGTTGKARHDVHSIFGLT